MKILLLGSGGREHALAWKIEKSILCNKLYIAPGNPGTAEIGKNVNIAVTDFEAIKNFCIEKNVAMVVVGPEEPLVRGIKNFFCEDESLKHIHLIGPDKAAAQLEGSKDFSKNFMLKYNIPTAKAYSVSEKNIAEANSEIDKMNTPIVLKADGLAAGKGVLILNDREDAKKKLSEMISGNMFGDAGKKVLIEEFLDGIELSVFVLTDGKNYINLPEAKDYKRIGENDTGLNTGGMGAISPVPFYDENFMKKVEEKIIKPTIAGIENEGMKYNGFVFFGIMKVGDEPFLIEYNVRMGDPETEAVLPRIENDIVELFLATAQGKLDTQKISISKKYSATIVLVSDGYPGNYKKGIPIALPENDLDTIVYHAGTAMNNETLVTNGGRVFAVTSLAKNASDAIKKSNDEAEKIQFDGIYFRKDIGKDLEMVS